MWVAKTTFFPHSTKSGWGVHWVLAFQRRSEMFAASNCFLCYKKQCGLSLRISVLSLSVGEGEGKEEVLLFLRKACWPFYFLWSNLLSVQFSWSVVSDSLRPHELKHARPPCPSPTHRSSLKLMSIKQRCHRKRKLQVNITNEHWCIDPQQNSSKQSPTTLKRSFIITKRALFQGLKDSSLFTNQSMWYTILKNWKIKSICLSQ